MSLMSYSHVVAEVKCFPIQVLIEENSKMSIYDFIQNHFDIITSTEREILVTLTYLFSFCCSIVRLFNLKTSLVFIVEVSNSQRIDFDYA